ncbi:MAG: hypothetical protein J0M29_07145 [Chitinophagales bacterium]|nr:hypothetical protein [Chitinophagales bacterium]
MLPTAVIAFCVLRILNYSSHKIAAGNFLKIRVIRVIRVPLIRVHQRSKKRMGNPGKGIAHCLA